MIGSNTDVLKKLHEAYIEKEKDIKMANEEYEKELKMIELKKENIINNAKNIFYIENLNLCREYLNYIIKCNPFCIIYDHIRQQATDPNYYGWLTGDITNFINIIKGYVKNDPNISQLFSNDIINDAFKYKYNPETGEIIFK